MEYRSFPPSKEADSKTAFAFNFFASPNGVNLSPPIIFISFSNCTSGDHSVSTNSNAYVSTDSNAENKKGQGFLLNFRTLL
jgi:hypothetical protein